MNNLEEDEDKTSRAVIRGSGLFNTKFSLPRAPEENREIFEQDPKRLPAGAAFDLQRPSWLLDSDS
jgi:hypothetical protein